MHLEQESTDVFCKGPECKYFSFYKSYSLCINYLILPLYCETSYKQCINDGCGYGPIKLYLWILNFEFRIIVMS